MRNHRLIWQSSYDRGLQHLLKIWPEVLKEVPDATLELFYGWETFDKYYHDNAERMAWKKQMVDMMGQQGITHHGRVGQKELREYHKNVGIFAYPTHFQETFCIGVVESQLAGVVPVTMNLAALQETVGSGIKVVGDIYDPKVRQIYLQALLTYMKDEKLWQEESEKAKAFAKQYAWTNIAKKWTEHF